MIEHKPESSPTPQGPRRLEADEARRLLREGHQARREAHERLARMEKLDPKDAAARAR